MSDTELNATDTENTDTPSPEPPAVTETNETTEESDISAAGAPLKTSTPKQSSSALPPTLRSPRAGGYIKGLPSGSNVSRSAKSANQSSHSSMSVFYAKSRERRINLLLEDSEWDLGEELDVCSTDTLADNMLAVTISCIMLMATGVEDIPEEYLIYAENYLACVKDDSDYHPPNVQGILNHIAYLRETMNRTRDHTKEDCKCPVDEEDTKDCNKTACATRSSSKIKYKKDQSHRLSRCGIPVRKKSKLPIREA